MRTSSKQTEKIRDAAQKAEYKIVEITEDGKSATAIALTASGLEFKFEFSYQGIWDTEENTYVDLEEIDAEFDEEDRFVDGMNLIAPDNNTGRYHRSYILTRCTTPSGEKVIDY